MKVIKILTLVIALPLLSACDVVGSYSEMVRTQVADTTFYILPATELQIADNEISHVYGFEECPRESVKWLFGNSPSVTDSNCIKLTPETNSVKVRVVNDQVDVIETWNVSRIGDAVSLTRPSGFKVREQSNVT